MIAKTGDDFEIKVGDSIWVRSNIEGNEPKLRVVGKILNKNKIEYDKHDEDGYIGCKTSSAFKIKENAYWLRFKPLSQLEIVDRLSQGKLVWGLYDTHDDFWLGSGTTPLIYETELVAKYCSRIMCARFQWPPTRVRERSLDSYPLKKRDEISPEISAEEALRRLEEGLVL